MADERLGAEGVAGALHERVLQLARNPPDVEHPVAALHPFQSIAPTSMPSPKRKLAGVASPCSHTWWSAHMRSDVHRR
jgi:hypothetical protein